jgi:hypothetical protein
MVCTHRGLLGTVIVRLLAVVLVLGGVIWVCVRGIDSWAVPEADEDPDQEARRGGWTDNEECLALQRRVGAKVRLAREVIDGRLTLLEAAARFRDLNREPPLFAWVAFRAANPGASDDELLCREVISYVHLEQRGQPGTDAGLVARLEAELNERLERGDLHLPATDLGGGETDRRH